MDTITQALLGAACGNVCARHKLGKHAARWGALAGALPDLDTVSAFFGDWAQLRYHRGFTHALWFGPLVGPLLGFLLWRYHQSRPQLKQDELMVGSADKKYWWMWLMVVGILSHPLLDLFTTYGTQLFTPFSDQRYAINGIGIIDPLYTVPLIIALLWGRDKGPASRRRRVRASAVAVAFTTAYLFYGVWLNHGAKTRARVQLQAEGVKVTQVHAYPRVLQIFLRRVTARAQDGQWYIGEISMWSPHPIRFHRATESDSPLVAKLRATKEGKLFQWFAMDQTLAHVEQHGDEQRVRLEDMRYGEMSAPERSMWGIEQRYRADGSPLGPPKRFRNMAAGEVGKRLSTMFRNTFWPDERNN